MFSQPSELNIETDLEYVRDLGIGYSSKQINLMITFKQRVHLYKIKQTNELVALKLFKIICTSHYDRELKILSNLNIANVVKLYGFGKFLNEKNRNAPFLALEYFQNGSLLQFIQKNGPLNEMLANYFFSKILKIVQNIHENNFVHRDLTLGNIMINNQFEPVLIDFAFGCIYNAKSGRINELVGTLPYIAPEILEDSYYHPFQIEIFSLGVILYQMLKGHVPFARASLEDQEFMKFIQNEDDENEGLIMAKKMMNIDPKKRPTIELILTEFWMKQKIDENVIQDYLRLQLMK